MFMLPAECRSGETQMLPFISNEKKWVGRGGIKFKTSITILRLVALLLLLDVFNFAVTRTTIWSRGTTEKIFKC